MKILILSILSVLILSSCASNKMADGDHHHHKCKMKNCDMNKLKGDAFSKHCAMSLSMGDSHVAGKKEYNIKHNGQTYYFSTEAKMNKFNDNLEDNITRAREHWSAAERR